MHKTKLLLVPKTPPNGVNALGIFGTNLLNNIDDNFVFMHYLDCRIKKVENCHFKLFLLFE